MANFKNKDLQFIGIILLCNILPRLIYILDNSFFINGDEALFGVMVRDFLHSGQLPLFFYGNNYLFVFFEVLLSSIVSFFFGVNIYSMKVAMLVFWLISMVLLYYIGKKLFFSKRLSLLAVLLVSFIPVWFDWATKASGGYLTALLFSNIVILLTLSKKSVLRIITISISCLIVYYAQPLWLIIIFPFIVYYFLKNFKFKYASTFIISSIIFWVSSHFFLSASNFNYQLQNKLGSEQLLRNIKNIFNNYSIAYSGRFFDAAVLKINLFQAINSGIFVAILTVTIIYNIYLFCKKKINQTTAIFLTSIILYILFMLLYSEQEYSHRYLLPIFIPSILLIILTIKQLTKIKIKNVLFILLFVYSFFSLICSIYSYNHVFPSIKDGYTEVERIEALKEFLQSNDIKCVYTLDWIISQHIYYFIPEVSVRHQDIDNRRPQDSIEVDFYQQSNKCALVGLWYHLPSFTSLYNLNDIYIINNRYVVHLYPQKDDLLKLKFQLTN